MTRQLSFRLDGLCDVCRYPVQSGECHNPVCGGTDEAFIRFAQAAIVRQATEAARVENLRIIREAMTR
jgi:hypothetical protein